MSRQAGHLQWNSVQEHFEWFHEHRPEVYAYFIALCFELKRKGFTGYGARAVIERVRWHFQVERLEGEDFKLNNDFSPRYARKAMREHPELEGFLRLRALKRA